MASVPNLRTNVLLRSEQSGGHVSMVENVIPAHSARSALNALRCIQARGGRPNP